MSVLVSFPNSLLKYSCSTCTQNHILILKPDTPSYTQPCVCVFSLQFSVSLLWWRREEKLNYLTTVPLVMCLLLHGNTVVLHSWLHMHIFIYRYIFFETLTHSQHTLAINNKNRPIPLLTQDVDQVWSTYESKFNHSQRTYVNDRVITYRKKKSCYFCQWKYLQFKGSLRHKWNVLLTAAALLSPSSQPVHPTVKRHIDCSIVMQRLRAWL